MKPKFLRIGCCAIVASLELRAQADWMSGCDLRIAYLIFDIFGKIPCFGDQGPVSSEDRKESVAFY